MASAVTSRIAVRTAASHVGRRCAGYPSLRLCPKVCRLAPCVPSRLLSSLSTGQAVRSYTDGVGIGDVLRKWYHRFISRGTVGEDKNGILMLRRMPLLQQKIEKAFAEAKNSGLNVCPEAWSEFQQLTSSLRDLEKRHAEGSSSERVRASVALFALDSIAADIEGTDAILLLSKLHDAADSKLKRFAHCSTLFCASNLECMEARDLSELKSMMWSSGVDLPDDLVDRVFHAADRKNAGRITPQEFAEVLLDVGQDAFVFTQASSVADYDEGLMKALRHGAQRTHVRHGGGT